MKYGIKCRTRGITNIVTRSVFLFSLLIGSAVFALAQSPVYIAHLDHTYMVLQAANNSLSSGTPIVLGERNDGKATLQPQQIWYYDNATQTIRLIANHNKCMARKGQQLLNDPIVVADYSANSDLQRWVLEDHKLKLLSNKLLCIGLPDANFTPGTAVVLQEVSSIITNQQKWFFREKPANMFTTDGKWHRVNPPGETYIEFAIPDPCPYSYLNINARGGDGGYRSVHNILTGKEDVKARGGQGANMGGTFKIGTGDTELRPGTTIRLVIGYAGSSRANNGNSIGSSGGAGTGVVYEKRQQRDTSNYYYPWHVLAIAGGGGGAFADCCAVHSDGYSGCNTTKINEGSGYLDETNHEYGGYRRSDDQNIGSGFRADSDPYRVIGSSRNGSGAGFHAIDGILYPTGGKYTYNEVGAFGFGGGGVAGNVLTRAGGGGGYSGAGQVGYNGSNGAGGGSYVDQYFLAPGTPALAKTNGTTASPANGWVDYQFTNESVATRDLYYQADKGTEVEVLKTGDWTLKWQYDGNLVLYQSGVGAKWASNTQNKGLALRFQGDGNLVIYQNGTAVWASATANSQKGGNGGRKLVLTPFGELYITDQYQKIIWQGH